MEAVLFNLAKGHKMKEKCNDPRLIPDPKTMDPGEMGDAMRQRAEVLKSKLPSHLAETVDIFLDMASQVSAMSEGLVTDYGKVVLVTDLQRLDALLVD
jgi:hypothetical protein